MSTPPPPSRYRVVERGRRLVVIDSTTGAEASAPSASAATPATPQRASFDGRATLTTRRWYDSKGPRTLILDPGAAELVNRVRLGAVVLAMVAVIAAVSWPVLFAAPLVLANRRLRDALRRAATGWLDRYDTRSSAG